VDIEDDTWQLLDYSNNDANNDSFKSLGANPRCVAAFNKSKERFLEAFAVGQDMLSQLDQLS
jgi:hypothetical protein